MVGSIRQWDTDWFNQFKTIFPTTLTNLQIYPGNPIDWINVKNVVFGNKQAESSIRMPDQRVQVGKEVEYKDKYAARVTQTADMPALWDSIRIKEEYYAGDVVNAIGHVGDLFENFQDGISNFVYNGSTIDPLAYGVLDGGSGTGTKVRPDKCDDVSTVGNWDTPAHMFVDLANMENELEDKGFFGPKRILAPSLYKPYLNLVLTSTITPYKTWVSTIGGYAITFTPHVDSDASSAVSDVYMVDENAYNLFMNPLKVRGFFDNNTEDFVWHWKTRAYLLPTPKYHKTDAEWKKALVKIPEVRLH